jgi:hypothetical protein
MAPSAIDVDTPIHSKPESRKPLKYSGSLDSYESFDPTPAIGTEYPTANLVDWLNAPNADELIRDLAIKSIVPLSCGFIFRANVSNFQSLSAVWSSSGSRIT